MHLMMNLLMVTCFYYGVLLWWLAGGRAAAQALKEGDAVTLPCEIYVDFEVMWFLLRPNSSLSLVMLTNVRADGVSLSPTTQFDARLVPVYDSGLKRMALRIRNVSSVDVGRYYCAKRVGNMFRIGNLSEVTLSTLEDEDCWVVIGLELPGLIALIAAPPISVLLSAAVILFCPLYNKQENRRKQHR